VSLAYARRVLVVSFTLLIAAGAYAQDSASVLRGRVLDPDGLAVVGATVTAGEGKVTTASNGEFVFATLRPGTYTLAAESPGFKRSELTVTTGATAMRPVEVRLAIDSFATSVDVTGVKDRTVSVSKLNVPVKELPATINIVTSETIAEQGTNDLVSALKNVNSIYPYVGYGVYESYVFRGFTESVQLVDGVRTEGNRINTQTANVERIEVLKGPGSVLSGNEAFGGTVNLVRKKPSAERLYDLTMSAGSWGSRRVSGGASGPLVGNSLLYRLDFSYAQADGWRGNEQTRVNVTPSIDWIPTMRDRVSFYLTFNRDRFATDSGIPVINGEVPNIPSDRRLNAANDFARSLDLNYQWRYAHTLGRGIELRDTLSYRYFDDQYLSTEGMIFTAPSTISRKYLYFQHHRRPWLNQMELAVARHALVDHRLVAGYEYQRYNNVTDRSSASDQLAPAIDLFNPIESSPDIPTPLTRLDFFRNTYHAAYVHDQMDVTSRLHLHVAGRQDWYDRFNHNDPVSTAGIVTAGPSTRRETAAFTTRAGAVYQFTPAYSTYASYATSFRPVNTVPADGRNLDPETGRQYEVGQRFETAGGRLVFNNAVYEILKRNVAIARGGGLFDQAGEQRSRGAEVEVTGEPMPLLHVTGSYGYTRAVFPYFISGGADLSGKTPRFTPRHTFSLWSGYETRHGVGGNIGARYVSSVFTNNTNTTKWGGYTLVDAALSLNRGMVRYGVNLNNITNRRYFVGSITGVDSRGVSEQLYPGRAREVLFTVALRNK
jgi:iron complex outermembrane receptor protein